MEYLIEMGGGIVELRFELLTPSFDIMLNLINHCYFKSLNEYGNGKFNYIILIF